MNRELKETATGTRLGQYQHEVTCNSTGSGSALHSSSGLQLSLFESELELLPRPVNLHPGDSGRPHLVPAAGHLTQRKGRRARPVERYGPPFLISLVVSGPPKK